MRKTTIGLVLFFGLFAHDLTAARITVGTGSGSAGGTATLSLTYASEGASVAILQVDLLASAPLSYSSVSAGAAATAAGKQVSANAISGGIRLLVYGLNQTTLGDGAVGNISYSIASGAANGSYTVTATNASAADPSGSTVSLSASSGSVTVGSGGGGPPAATWLLPSSARAQGQGGAFFTTDVTVANTGAADASFTLKFLGNNVDGRNGAESTFSLAAGRSTTLADVLSSVFGLASGFGAIQVRGSVTSLAVVSQTSTPGPNGGTFGQSVPAPTPIASGSSRSILAVREDGSFRTNLIIANATEANLDVLVTLISGAGATLGSKTYSLPPLGMTQVTKVVRDLGISTDVSGARLVLSTSTAGGSFSAYASAIDNTTGDPRTLLAQ